MRSPCTRMGYAEGRLILNRVEALVCALRRERQTARRIEVGRMAAIGCGIRIERIDPKPPLSFDGSCRSTFELTSLRRRAP